MKRVVYLVMTAYLTLSTAHADGTVKTLNVAEGSIEFLAIGRPSAIKIRGKGDAPKGSVAIKGRDVTGEVSFELSSLDTGMSLRTRHMKEKYLEVAKFPSAIFRITKMTLPQPLEADGSAVESVPVEGVMTLHGVSKPVTASASLKNKNGKISGHVAFKTSISGFAMPVPVYLGITVADQVEVDVDLTTSSM